MAPPKAPADERTPLKDKNGGGAAEGGGGAPAAASAAASAATAREAFRGDDAEASRRYHDSRRASSSAAASSSGSSGAGGEEEEGHKAGGGFLKPVIFGGLDGILTSFAIVAGAAGGNLSPQVVLILGFSNILADALSMGVGEFLSSKATNEWILSERSREEWELENYPEGEIREMVDIYVAKGMSVEDATKVIGIMAGYKDFFVDLMMLQELELQVPEDDHVRESVREGFIMFASFATFGALPLLGYVVIPAAFPGLGEGALFVSACVVTGTVLFFMGCIKSWFSTQHWFRCGAETLLLGGACATVAYTVGQLVNSYLGGGPGE
jgi:DNA damage-binding protein 1